MNKINLEKSTQVPVCFCFEVKSLLLPSSQIVLFYFLSCSYTISFLQKLHNCKRKPKDATEEVFLSFPEN